MICEPNCALSQNINLESLKKSNTTDNNVEKISQNYDDIVVHKVSYEQKEFNLLPVFYDQFVHLNETLSLKSNKYLAQRWNQFLDNVPKNYVRIRLYIDYKKSLEKREVKPMLLNGKFFGVDNRLAPIPQLIDPRNLEIKKK